MELRLSILMGECTVIIYTLTEFEILFLGSKPPNSSIHRSYTNKISIYSKIKHKPLSL